MSAVKAHFAAAGCANVTTYIQSGNVLFDAPAARVRRCIENVRQRLAEACGEDAVLMVRSLRAVAEIVERAPFGARSADPTLKLYVVFLARRPRRRIAVPFADEKERLEAIAVCGREAYVVSGRKSSGFYGFPNAFVERALGIAATSRNWSTVRKLAALGAD